MFGDPWKTFSLYATRDLLERFYRKRHGRELNAGKAKEIASNLFQGKAYFDSLQSCEEIVRPVLLYYGVLSLVRAMILFCRPEARECSLKPGHGLSTVGWASLLAGGLDRLQSLPISFTGGTFSDFVHATGNTEEHRQYVGRTGPGDFEWFRFSLEGTIEFGSDDIVTLDDVLSRIPDLAELYETIYSQKSNCYSAHISASSERAPFLFSFDRAGVLGVDGVADSVIQRDFGFKCDLEVKTYQDIKQIELSNETWEAVLNVVPFFINYGNNICVLPPIRNQDKSLNFSYFALLFLASYFFGMLARYFPTVWLRLVQREKRTNIYPLVEQALTVIRERIPQSVVRAIEVKVDT